MISTEELMRLKRRINQKNEERIRAESARDQALKQLQEYGYDSIEEAKKELETMQMQIAKEEAKIEQLLNKLEEDYPEL